MKTYRLYQYIDIEVEDGEPTEEHWNALQEACEDPSIEFLGENIVPYSVPFVAVGQPGKVQGTE